ncbi:uncharacterized protein LOC102703632 [Oryza brachyantha]|uniref:uncharacterized protein LOC102703632 n=1 Tax=Oryza brachyantha TaxID=4533 RepID=UPI001ADA35AF|nr:uncharacterized protein LOC102703632 [Oryza brachyantha]
MTPPAKRHRCSPPELNDDVIREILLRLPPDDPALLVRCSLVCKSWRRLLSSDPVFLRSYRDFHRTPPLLGFLFNQFGDEPDVACFAPTSSFRLPNPHHRDWYALDARHGLVLFTTTLSHDAEAVSEHELVVWDPMTGRRWRLEFPDFVDNFNWCGSVFCAADRCDHRDCHGVPFLVAVASNTRYFYTTATIYSSETGAWGSKIKHGSADPADAVRMGKPGVWVGNALYFLCVRSARILECDMGGRQPLAVFDSPVAHRRWPDNGLLLKTHGGGPRFAFARQSMLYLWSREAGADGAMAWSPLRGINLEPLLAVLRRPDDHHRTTPNLIFADGVRVVLAEIGGAIFTVELSSRRGKKVYSRDDIHTVFPYTSFYTPRA